MRISRIDQTLTDCESLLSSANAFGTEIENLLTQSLLVVIYAEFEQKINNILKDKCLSIKDDSIKKFFESSVGEVFRSMKSTDMGDFLGRFGATYKENYRQQIKNNQKAETSYGSILTNRHNVAHGKGTNASFREVKQYYEEGHVLLDFFQNALLREN